MAGFGAVNLIMEGRIGPIYGTPMWKYTQESLSKSTAEAVIKKVQKVAYSPILMMDVQAKATYKKYYTCNDGVVTPSRHWSQNFPQNEDLIPDLGYVSVHPSWPNEKAQTCCVFNIGNDPREITPLDVNCEEMKEEASQLFYGPIACEEAPSVCTASLGSRVNPPEAS